LFHLITFTSPVLPPIINRRTGPGKLVTNLLFSENNAFRVRCANDILPFEVLTFRGSIGGYSEPGQAIHLAPVV
jgi:hypothetical protein